MLQPKWRYLLLGIVLINLIFCSWLFLHADLHFKSDVARDFLLFQEISEKKVVLLGPRASGILGVYHGPMWLYMTYPAFLLGNGNPVVVAWYWMVLILAGLGLGFWVMKRLFSELSAWFFVILLSGLMITEASGLINPHGGLLLMPLFYFFLIRYLEKGKPGFLLGHVLVGGALFQFQMAVGIPLILLSAILIVIQIFRKRQYWHVLVYAALSIPLSTFILFELRHDFAQTMAVLHSKKQSSLTSDAFIGTFLQRVLLAVGEGYQIFRVPLAIVKAIPSAVVAYYYLALAKTQDSTFINRRGLVLLYLFIGSFAFTLIIPGLMMSHQWLPLASLGMMLFAGLIIYLPKWVYVVVVGLLVVQNWFFGYQVVQKTATFSDRFDSWAFQKKISSDVLSYGDTDFGYFVYAPDIYAYGPKYAMQYVRMQNPRLSIAPFAKKRVTYVLSEPVPPDREDLSALEWRKSKFGILGDPESIINYDNGYLLERFVLTDDDLNREIDPNLDTGVFFR